MISEKQLEANRRNAQNSERVRPYPRNTEAERSTSGQGPKTIEGKAHSSRNNLRHGLTGQISLLPTEDREAHDAFCTELFDSFHTETPMERQLAQSVAEDSWRLNRARAIEDNMFALGHAGERRELQIALADAKCFQEQANQFNLLTIYEQRINRNLQRNLKLLRELQAERKVEREQAMEEAKLLAELSLSQGLAWDPAEFSAGASPLCGYNSNGFVFSSAEVNIAIDRTNRLKAARQADLAPREPVVPQSAHQSAIRRAA
jgi:hypothetical protein